MSANIQIVTVPPERLRGVLATTMVQVLTEQGDPYSPITMYIVVNEQVMHFEGSVSTDILAELLGSTAYRLMMAIQRITLDPDNRIRVLLPSNDGDQERVSTHPVKF